MRIAIVAHGLSDGGAERVASLLANHYAQVGHDVLYIAAYSSQRAYALREEISYVYVGGNETNKLSRLFCRSRRIDRALRAFRADAAVSFIRNEAVYSTLRKTVPVVYSLRIDPGQVCARALDRIGCLLAFYGAKKVIFQTPDARDYFPEKIRKKGVVIPNPLTRNLPDWKGTEACEKTVITACRLNEQKNLPMLISAFAAFRKKYPEYTLHIYGEGELKEELKAFANRCGVAESVFFPGYARNIHEIMANSGIFALTSDYEGLSNSMLEALAIGIPTVCTDCPPGGAKLYIEDGVSGMLVPVGDTEALTEKLCQMAEDPALCRKLSENSRKIRGELDVDKVLGQWETVLQ